MKTLITILLLTILQLSHSAIDPKAIADCEALYHNSHVQIAEYQSLGCKLMCAVNNKIQYSAIREGHHCSALSGTAEYFKKICKGGDCVDDPNANHTGSTSYGFIDVTVVKGELPNMDPSFNPKPDGFVKVCLQPDIGPIQRPLMDTSGCECTTNVVKMSNTPTWNYTCHNWPRNQRFKNDTRIIFEVWDDDAPDADEFIGSQSTVIPELIQKRNNGVNQIMDLYKIRKHEAQKHGSLTVRITWTADH